VVVVAMVALAWSLGWAWFAGGAKNGGGGIEMSIEKRSERVRRPQVAMFALRQQHGILKYRIRLFGMNWHSSINSHEKCHGNLFEGIVIMQIFINQKTYKGIALLLSGPI
jgi:hypothetical protein